MIHPSLEDLALCIETARHLGESKRVVLANGCFEILHPGHEEYLAAARASGDLLIVAVNGDASVARLKGEGRPLIPFAERAARVHALDVVDHVIGFEQDTVESVLRTVRPDIHAKGSDYSPETIPECSVDRELGIEIAICGGPKVHSSTHLARTGNRESTGA